VGDYAACIVVEDASGCRFQLYEYRERRLFSSVTEFLLDTGEPVKRVSPDTYVIAATGETLVRTDAS
jgi:hypothetical protein